MHSTFCPNPCEGQESDHNMFHLIFCDGYWSKKEITSKKWRKSICNDMVLIKCMASMIWCSLCFITTGVHSQPFLQYFVQSIIGKISAPNGTTVNRSLSVVNQNQILKSPWSAEFQLQSLQHLICNGLFKGKFNSTCCLLKFENLCNKIQNCCIDQCCMYIWIELIFCIFLNLNTPMICEINTCANFKCQHSMWYTHNFNLKISLEKTVLMVMRSWQWKPLTSNPTIGKNSEIELKEVVC